jgi:hypothetical protein
MTKDILILGNGPQINSINFDKLDPNIITLGVNRIWLKHYPNYFFFHDLDILKELDNSQIDKAKLISNSKCITSDWINKSGSDIPHWITKHSRIDRRKFPDSVTTSIEILLNKILKLNPSRVNLYIAGVNLKWTDPSHFWKESKYHSLNKADRSWYDTRFQKIVYNFKQLKSKGYNIVSVTPESNLNKIFRYVNISNLYKD